MPRKHFRKYLPDHASIREHRYLKHMRPLLRHPNQWHLNRHSVAGGVAAGMFAGMIPGPVQMLSGALLAILFRVNIPVAMAATWYTNPITWGPLLFAAYWVGSLFTGESLAQSQPPEFDWSGHPWTNYLPELWHWLLSLGETFLIGCLVLALVLAATGYAVVLLAWRLYILAYLRRRRQRRRACQT